MLKLLDFCNFAKKEKQAHLIEIQKQTNAVLIGPHVYLQDKTISKDCENNLQDKAESKDIETRKYVRAKQTNAILIGSDVFCLGKRKSKDEETRTYVYKNSSLHENAL